MTYNMKEHKEKGVDLGLRQFIKSLGYVAGGTALLATTPWLTSCTPEKLKEIKHEKARIALIGTGSRGQYHIHNLKEILNDGAAVMNYGFANCFTKQL